MFEQGIHFITQEKITDKTSLNKWLNAFDWQVDWKEIHTKHNVYNLKGIERQLI